MMFTILKTFGISLSVLGAAGILSLCIYINVAGYPPMTQLLWASAESATGVLVYGLCLTAMAMYTAIEPA
jgi:hypothetical protein